MDWATTFQPWIQEDKDENDDRRSARVSIGPRLFSHGNLRRNDESIYGFNQGFNWATTFQPWKYYYIISDFRNIAHVSIGPRLFSHGNS